MGHSRKFINSLALPYTTLMSNGSKDICINSMLHQNHFLKFRKQFFLMDGKKYISNFFNKKPLPMNLFSLHIIDTHLHFEWVNKKICLTGHSGSGLIATNSGS
jgi:hypothetical protein